MDRNALEDFSEDDDDWEVLSLLKTRQKRDFDQENSNFFKLTKKTRRTDELATEKKTKRRVDKRNAI